MTGSEYGDLMSTMSVVTIGNFKPGFANGFGCFGQILLRPFGQHVAAFSKREIDTLIAEIPHCLPLRPLRLSIGNVLRKRRW